MTSGPANQAIARVARVSMPRRTHPERSGPRFELEAGGTPASISARGGRRRLAGAALARLLDADTRALALVEALALQRRRQPFMAHTDVPECSIRHSARRISSSGSA